MEKVFVSGGSGYIALHCISQLIIKGFLVKTSLRNLDRKQEVIDSIKKIADCDGKLEFCELDLMVEDGWEESIRGCDYVLHIASPLIFGTPKNPDDLIQPAVKGLEKCLKASVKNRVKKFVMTSSFAAIGSGSNKTEFNDEDWTSLDSKIHAYNKSKTMAEIYMWDYINNLSEDQRINVCAINPVVVIGPSLSDDVGISNLAVRKLLDGSLPFMPKLGVDLVDVRDVADIHIKAMLSQEANGKRFLLSSHTLWYSEIANILKDSGYKKVPKITVPNIFVRIFAIFDKEARIALDRLGKKYTLNADNAFKILDWKPRDIKNTIIETAKQLEYLKIIKK